MQPRVEAVREIAASPEAVYAAISDVTRMGEWSDECHGCEWHVGYDGAVVGATFDGHNRVGDRAWTSQGKVVEADPGRSFVFECSMFDVHYSTWGYTIEATANGSRVTEWTQDLRSEQAMQLAMKISGVIERGDRDRSEARNRTAMSRTLDRLAAALES